MKIRTKITLLTGILVFISLLLIFGQHLIEQGRTQLFLDGIKAEEQKSFNQLLDLSGSRLKAFAEDYSYWDEMVVYVNHPNVVFADENIGGSMATYDASEVFVYNKKRELVYGYDVDHPAIIVPNFPIELLEKFFKNRLSHFFIKNNNTLTEFRVATIHPTNDPERLTEPEGLFIVGKRWDKDHLLILEKLSSTTIIPQNEKILDLGIVSIIFPYEVKDWDNNVVETFTIISPYPIVSSIQQASKLQIWIIIASLLLVLFLVYIFLQILVGRPIEALSSGIKKKDLPLMKKMEKSTSEFGTLAKLVLDFSEHELVLEAKAKDESILSAVGSGLIAINKERKITLFNVAAENMIGVVSERALGMQIEDVFKAETQEGIPLLNDQSPFALTLNKKIIVSKVVFCVRSDGTKFPGEITVAPVILNSEIIGAVLDLRDITVQESFEQSKRDFISLVSHELRTPLTSLGWAVDKFKSQKDIPIGILESTIPYMTSALNRIRTLVAAMVDVSKIENSSLIIKINDIDVSLLIALTLENLKQMIEIKKLTVTINNEIIGNKKIQSDEHLLQLIIDNMVANAVRYCNENGKVNIIIKEEGQELSINISNTGPGIPKEEQSRVFSKMFRATNAKLLSPDGVGLGLYISKSFLERLGGSMTFVSIPNEETVFSIRLPSKYKDKSATIKSDS